MNNNESRDDDADKASEYKNWDSDITRHTSAAASRDSLFISIVVLHWSYIILV